jgi:5-oxoprolinase (ATP-hydrolysing) subunit A
MLINVDCGEELNEYDESHDRVIIKNCDLINLACGGHAGSPKTIKHCVNLSKQFNTLVGAHPSFIDKANFGRQVVDLSFNDLVKDIHYQIKLIYEQCKDLGVKMHHVKPHGALYNVACKDEQYALAVIKAVKKLNEPKLKLLAPQYSMMAVLAENEFIPIIYESFADRRYEDDGSLQSRNKFGSVYEDVNEITKQFSELLDGYVTSSNNNKVAINADSVCVHGEHTNIEDILIKMIEMKMSK